MSSDEDEAADEAPADRDSDDNDFFDMEMAARSSLSSEYLNTPRMQWIIAAEELGQHLRSQPLLPSKFKHSDETFTDVDSGICLPKWHCVFAGCLPCAEENTSNEIVQEKVSGNTFGRIRSTFWCSSSLSRKPILNTSGSRHK